MAVRLTNDKEPVQAVIPGRGADGLPVVTYEELVHAYGEREQLLELAAFVKGRPMWRCSLPDGEVSWDVPDKNVHLFPSHGKWVVSDLSEDAPDWNMVDIDSLEDAVAFAENPEWDRLWSGAGWPSGFHSPFSDKGRP